MQDTQGVFVVGKKLNIETIGSADKAFKSSLILSRERTGSCVLQQGTSFLNVPVNSAENGHRKQPEYSEKEQINGEPNTEQPDTCRDAESEYLSTGTSDVLFREVVPDDDTKCGYFGFKPDWLQRCNNPKCLLACLCWFAAIQGFVVSGINNVNTSTIERRFLLPSSRVGMISSAYDVSAAILGLIISFFGSRRNKPRLITMATIAMALGSFIMILPHITTDNYHWGEEAGDTCGATEKSQECSNENENVIASNLYLFLFGQILHGLGGTTLYTIGITLIDDSVPTSSSPLYLGILYSFATLGPALGYLIGGQFLNIYVDFDASDRHRGNLTPDDPRWVGAWWIGYIFASFLSLLIAVPISAFGKELPGASAVRATRVSQAYTTDNEGEELETNKTGSIRNLPTIVCSLIQNPIFILLTLAGSVEGLSTSGFATFLPKLIQNQFGVSAANASMYGGLVAVPGAAGGQLVGGLICKKWKLNVHGMLKFMMIVCLAAIVLDSVVWIRCNQEAIAGVTRHYTNISTGVLPSLQATCNQNCSCQTDYYRPICSPDNIQYFSPCHAGCQRSNADRTEYYECTCLHEQLPSSNITQNAVRSGKCTAECLLIYIFLVVLLLGIFFRFMLVPSAVSVTLRCIGEKKKTFGLGVQWFVVRLVGTIPGPMLFGTVIDNSCLVWQEKCGEQSSCWVYNNGLLSRNFFVILFSVKIFESILFILAYKIYKSPSEKSSEANLNFQTDTELGYKGSDVVCGNDVMSEQNSEVEIKQSTCTNDPYL